MIVAIMWIIGMITVVVYNVENKDDSSDSELVESVNETLEDQDTEIMMFLVNLLCVFQSS